MSATDIAKDVEQLSEKDRTTLREALEAASRDGAMKIAVNRQLAIVSPSVLVIRISSDRHAVWLATGDGVTRCYAAEIGTLIVEDESNGFVRTSKP